MQEFDDPCLFLPVRGHQVRIPCPTAREGLRLRRLLSDLGALTEERERAEGLRLIAEVLPQLDQLGADRVAVALIARTALLHFGKSPEAALAYWNGALGAAPADFQPADPSAPGYLGDDDPGGGPVDPVSGLRHWYNDPSMAPARTRTPIMQWADVLACWPEIQLDLHAVYGIDCGGPILDERPWSWLEIRIRDLATTPGTRLHRAIFPPTPPP
ncbi:DUF7426 family protein [Nocardia asteroides]|uniref:DUF7426 family protein n=1 Tax=Nocardia asteroides TaxID=1824 RepID=UPI0033E164F5